MSSKTDIEVEKFSAFVSYFEENGKRFAKIVKDVLKDNRDINAFVAHIERDTYSDDFDKIRLGVLSNCDLFIFINTIDSLSRLQIKNEFKMAYPNGYSDSPHLHIFYHAITNNRRSSWDFEQSIGFESDTILSYNQHDFESEDQLSTKVRQLFNRMEKANTSITNTDTPIQEPYLDLSRQGIFLGRAGEVTIITRIISENRITSVIGEGGIGKTSICYELLNKLKQHHQIIKVDIESTNFTKFISQVANAIKVLTDDVTIIKKKMAETNNALLFIDNFEIISNNLQNPGSQVNKILYFLNTLSDNVKILIASRNMKNIDNENGYILKGLSIEHGKKLFLQLTKNFLPANPDIQFMNKLDKMISRMEGHPLAIKLIAGNFYGGGYKELEQIFDSIMTISKSGEQPRHISLKDCFNYTYAKLPNNLKELLYKLIAFNSPFCRRQFEYTIKEQDFSKLLSLNNRSLISTYTLGTDMEPYFGFHPLIKTFLTEIDPVQNIPDEFYVDLATYFEEFLDNIYKNRKKPNEYLKYSKILNLLLSKEINDLDIIATFPIHEERKSNLLNKLVLVLLEFNYMHKGLIANGNCLSTDILLKDSFRIGNDYILFSAIFGNTLNYPMGIHNCIAASKHYKNSKFLKGLFQVYNTLFFYSLKLDRREDVEKFLVEINSMKLNHPSLLKDYENYMQYQQAMLYYYNKQNKNLAVIDKVKMIKKNFVTYNYPVRDLATFLISSGLSYEKIGKYQEAYDEYFDAYKIYERYGDIVKQHKMCRLIGKLLTHQSDEKPILEWLEKYKRLELEIKDRGLTFSQHEML